MDNLFIIERIFYSTGSLVALILGLSKLRTLLESPKIKMRSMLFFSKTIKNERGTKVIPLEYEFSLLNTGKDLIGEVIVMRGHVSHQLSSIINLRKNKPYSKEGIKEIDYEDPFEKETKEPIILKMFFRDTKGKKHAIREHRVGEGVAGSTVTKESF
jgi:hypothetical protein